ncbi:uncharacterized protein LOC129586633 [Paramacrobiotus metropolitanus]|uniref:uncharacterized protein LOC129586633 n=1 Tax=Paramacrobiotus metropolitanus TaxID=2943436 RepID=UPI002445F148|nr:uncharacterized protein LOC129586633 [Paramacrobiotus metropolitanus]
MEFRNVLSVLLVSSVVFLLLAVAERGVGAVEGSEMTLSRAKRAGGFACLPKSCQQYGCKSGNCGYWCKVCAIESIIGTGCVPTSCLVSGCNSGDCRKWCNMCGYS